MVSEKIVGDEIDDFTWNAMYNGHIPAKINGVPRNFILRPLLKIEGSRWTTWDGRLKPDRWHLPKAIRRQGRMAREFETFEGRAVETLFQTPDSKNPHKIHKFYRRRYCDECGAVVRYGVNGYTICQSCGLIHNDRVFFTEARYIRDMDVYADEDDRPHRYDHYN